MNTQLNRKPAPTSARYVSNGRADPWSSPPPRRFRAMRPTYGLQPMDREDKWPTWTKIVVIGGAILAAYVTLNGGKF